MIDMYRCNHFAGGYLLGDLAYLLLSWLLPPYRPAAANWQPRMSTFNKVHCKQRVVEGAFRTLKAEFQGLLSIDVTDIEQAVHIVLGACVLHNIA
ncbi:hypothetical protein HPB50_021485 [Hyalomma asiaticum]|uniref:Uncharacterized protein n=1 Tax=Hyalomma asiaticum TaxID=266040 RepID=A0ACB7SH32_HYAAI|nr:hypothetical protein HPB50_021485 [Hyalomma asiaticum]